MPVPTWSCDTDHDAWFRPPCPNFNVGAASCVRRGGRFKWNKFCQCGSGHLCNIEIRGPGPNVLHICPRGFNGESTGRSGGLTTGKIYSINCLDGCRKYPNMFVIRPIIAAYSLRFGGNTLKQPYTLVASVLSYGFVCSC